MEVAVLEEGEESAMRNMSGSLSGDIDVVHNTLTSISTGGTDENVTMAGLASAERCFWPPRGDGEKISQGRSVRKHVMANFDNFCQHFCGGSGRSWLVFGCICIKAVWQLLPNWSISPKRVFEDAPWKKELGCKKEV